MILKIIRASANRNEAKEKLREKYNLTEEQTNAILDPELYQLTGMERENRFRISRIDGANK